MIYIVDVAGQVHQLKNKFALEGRQQLCVRWRNVTALPFRFLFYVELENLVQLYSTYMQLAAAQEKFQLDLFLFKPPWLVCQI